MNEGADLGCAVSCSLVYQAKNTSPHEFEVLHDDQRRLESFVLFCICISSLEPSVLPP